MNNFFKDWLKQLDDLEFDLDMKGMNVADYFEEGKAELKEAVDGLKEKVEKISGGEKAQSLKGKLEHLQVQLALGKAETKDAFEEQKGKLETAISDLGEKLDEWEAAVEEKTDDITVGIKEKTEGFRTKLDMMRLHYHLAQADARDELEEKRKALRTRIHETKTKLKSADEKEGDEESRWDEVKEELGESFSHLQNAIKGLFK
jgi:uncharacterized protein involved in exopolysaccharide biosynthesis